MYFLDPLQIDGWRYAYQQIDVTRHIDFVGDDAAMQAFIEQQIGAGLDVLPRRECARLLLVGGRLFLGVQILAQPAGAVGGIAAKQRLEVLDRKSVV